MEFPSQEYWSGLPFPTPRDLPDPEVKAESLASPALAGGFFATVLILNTAAAAKSLQSCPTLVTPCQAPLSVGFSRQESWSGLPFPSPVLSWASAMYGVATAEHDGDGNKKAKAIWWLL